MLPVTRELSPNLMMCHFQAECALGSPALKQPTHLIHVESDQVMSQLAACCLQMTVDLLHKDGVRDFYQKG